MTDQSMPEFNPEISEKMQDYLKLLLTENEKVNLTAIRDYDEAVVKHLKDSLAVSLCEFWGTLQVGMDLGTGGGLPGLPLAIAYPDKHFILLEASQKKVKFLQLAVDNLNLKNVQIVNGRAEEIGHLNEYREKLDFVLSRAVSALNVLMELSLPFLKVGGKLIAYKGPGIVEEIKGITHAQELLFAADPTVISYRLPGQMGDRSITVMDKLRSTPKAYPRRPGIPEKRPL